MQNFGYMIGDDRTKDALIIDPAWAPDTIFKTVANAGFHLKALAITHAHYDHTNAIGEILDKVDIPVYANKNEIPFSKSGNRIVGELGRTAKPLDGGDKIKLGDTEITVLHTPGHTPGSQCLMLGNYLITGDTLFIGGCGRSDLPGGDPGTLFESLKKIRALPSDLHICPGHDYGVVPERALSEEIQANPYLQMRDVQTFLEAVT